MSVTSIAQRNFLQGHFEDIEVGDSFLSRGRTVTETDIVNWCSLTGDWNVLHTNSHYAMHTRFGQRIAPGLLVLAYAAGLGIPADGPAIVANYGTDKLRFTAPTFIGDTIQLRTSVLEKIVKRPGKDGIVSLQWDVYNQNGVLVMSSVLKILMSCAGAGN